MLSIGVLKENIKGVSLWLTLVTALSIGPAQVWAKTKLSTDKISSLQQSVEKQPAQWKPRYLLARHFASEKKWQQTKDILTPVVESLPQKGLILLVRAQKELGDYLSMEPVVASLRSQPKLSLKAKIEVLEASVMVLRKTLRPGYAVGQSSDLDAAAKSDAPKDKEKSPETSETPEKAAENALSATYTEDKPKEPEAEKAKVAYASSPKIDDVALFFKDSLQSHPGNLKLNDLYLGFLEEFIDHYAFEGLFVLDELAKTRRLRTRHLSKLCQYSTMAGYAKRAIESCQVALQKDPKNIQNSIWLGKAHLFSGNEKKGSRVLASIAKTHKGSASALKASAEHFLESKNYPKAYKYFSRATGAKDVTPDVYLGLAKTAMELKKYDIALKAFQTHCEQTKSLHQDFRRASGLLAKQPAVQRQFRKIMRACNQ